MIVIRKLDLLEKVVCVSCEKLKKKNKQPNPSPTFTKILYCKTVVITPVSKEKAMGNGVLYSPKKTVVQTIKNKDRQ